MCNDERITKYLSLSNTITSLLVNFGQFVQKQVSNKAPYPVLLLCPWTRHLTHIASCECDEGSRLVETLSHDFISSSPWQLWLLQLYSDKRRISVMFLLVLKPFPLFCI